MMLVYVKKVCIKRSYSLLSSLPSINKYYSYNNSPWLQRAIICILFNLVKKHVNKNKLFFTHERQCSAVIDLKATPISLSALNPVLFTRLFSRWLLNSLFTFENTASIGWNSGLYPMFQIGSMSSFGHHSLTQGFLWMVALSMYSETGRFPTFPRSYLR